MFIFFQVDITPKGAEGGENYEEGSEVWNHFNSFYLNNLDKYLLIDFLFSFCSIIFQDDFEENENEEDEE